MFFSHVYSHWGQKFYDNRKAISLCPYVASFKMISSKSDFKHILSNFIHVYSLGTRAGNTLGTNFWYQQKALTTSTICWKFQTNLFEFWFYTHFLMFFHMHIAPGQGQTTLCGQNPKSTEKPCHFAHLLQVSKKYLWSLILFIFFHVFIHVYSPGTEADNPFGLEFLYKHKPFVTLVICCKFLPLNDFLTVFPVQKHKRPILTLP